MTWAEIEELNNLGYIEFGSHSYDLHQTNPDTGRYGTRILEGEAFEDYKNFLLVDHYKMQNKLNSIGIASLFFAFPYNDPCAQALEIFATEMDYTFLLVGDSDFFVKTRSNYYVNGIGVDRMDTNLVRRVTRHKGDDLKVLLESVWTDVE